MDEIQETGLQLSSESLSKLTTVHQAIHGLEEKLTGELLQSLRANETNNSSSLAEIRVSLTSVMAQLSAMPKLNTAENQILRQLYFNSFHSRNETISDAERGTFKWLLDDEHIDEGSLSDSQSETISQSNRSDDFGGIEKQSNDSLEPITKDKASKIVESEVEPDEYRIFITKAERKDEKAAQDLDQEALLDDESGGSCYLGAEEDGEEDNEENDNKDAEDTDDEVPSKRLSKASNYKPIIYPTELKMQRRVRQSFLTWLKSSNRIYHISGKAGSGKSTLMKFLTQHPRLMTELRDWSGGKKLVFAAFFFWASGDGKQRSLEGLYRSLLFETLKQCPELLKEAFPRFWADTESWAPEWKERNFVLSELKFAMNVIVENGRFPNHRFCFFIDGLDEFEGDSTDHWELAQMLQKWALSSEVKICVSSRPHTEFLDVFDSNLRMDLHELTRGDVHRFACAMLGNGPNSSGKDGTSSKIAAEIATEIVQMADGVFLWVRLVVRSLLDGVRHRSSLSVLKRKLHMIPRGLDSLFDKLINNIDPSDRELSDKMLILAASHGPLNALAYSWFEDLKDLDFPFKAPIQAYLDNDIEDRHTMVRCQLDSLTKGLLEMRIVERRYGDPRFDLTSKDIYFKYKVEFFHQTVRDYLTEPIRYASIKQRLGDFDTTEAHQRLLLAEFKFARTMNSYFTDQGIGQTALVSCFSKLFSSSNQTELPPRVLDEYNNVLEHHRRTPFSYPKETLENVKGIRWDQAWFSDRNSSGVLGKGISFLHWAAICGQKKYVMKQVLRDPTLVAPCNGLSLLLSSGLQHDLVHDLLTHGASPNHQITVLYKDSLHEEYRGPLFKDSSFRSQLTTLWSVYLFIMFRQFWVEIDARGLHEIELDSHYLIMEEFFVAGANSSVLFFLSKLAKEGNNKAVGGATDFITLEDMILAMRPPNADTLLKHCLKGKGSWLWNGTIQALSTLAPWSTGPNDLESRCKRMERDQFYASRSDLVLKSVRVGEEYLENGFLVRLW